MGRGILPIKKIEDKQDRKIKFSKRYPGVFKKGYEISALTGADFAVMTSNINGKLCYFSHPKRAEDALERFLNMPDNEKKVMDWNGHDVRITILDKDSLIAQLQDLKKEGDMSRMVENISTQLGNSGPKTSDDDNQFNQLNNDEGLLKQLVNFWSIYKTAPPTLEQLLDDFKKKLEVNLSHVGQTLLLQEHQQSEHMHGQVQEVSIHGQQPKQTSIHMQQVQERAYNNYMQLQQQAPNYLQLPHPVQSQYFFQLLQHAQGRAHNYRQRQQRQVQGGGYNMQLQQQPHNVQQQRASLCQNNNGLSTEGSLQAPIHTTKVTRQEEGSSSMKNVHINPTDEQYFNQMGSITGLDVKEQATSSHVITGLPSMLNPSTNLGSTYHTTRPLHFFYQQSTGDGVNNLSNHGQAQQELARPDGIEEIMSRHLP